MGGRSALDRPGSTGDVLCWSRWAWPRGGCPYGFVKGSGGAWLGRGWRRSRWQFAVAEFGGEHLVDEVAATAAETEEEFVRTGTTTASRQRGSDRCPSSFALSRGDGPVLRAVSASTLRRPDGPPPHRGVPSERPPALLRTRSLCVPLSSGVGGSSRLPSAMARGVRSVRSSIGCAAYPLGVPFRLRNESQVQTGPGSHPAASQFDKCIGDELGVRAFGLYQVELPGGAETVPHDHHDDGAEDAYAVIRGTGVVVVDDHEVPLGPGDFIAVTPESTRHVRADDGGLVFIAMCAPVAS